MCVRLHTDQWGDGTQFLGEVRANVTMSNRKNPYSSNSEKLVCRPDRLDAFPESD